MDIDRAGEAVKPAERSRIHTFISTSRLHMKYKLQMEPEEVLEAVYASVEHARNYCEDVEWSCEDGTRTDRDFMCRTVEAAIKAGATTINIPDTVGYTLPEEYDEIITMLVNRVPNIDQAILSTHYPEYIDPEIDVKIREKFPILLPREHMSAGSGRW